jgi:hypothetical protein
VNLPAALASAREGRLYPALILHGANPEARREAAIELARTLLCLRDGDRPCPPGETPCRNCRRIHWPDESDLFHPDFAVLERDLKTSTSVSATRELLQKAQVSPFEARGQVFVIADAETLSPEAANSLLKVLEEPPDSAPRNFMLLCPASHDLLPTLRSRSLSIYLGAAEEIDRQAVGEIAAQFAERVSAYAATGAAIYLLSAAESLAQAGNFDDPRAGRPWGNAAAAVLEALRTEAVPPVVRRRLLALADSLLKAPAMRLRAVGASRILEGLVCRHLTAPRSEAV